MYISLKVCGMMSGTMYFLPYCHAWLIGILTDNEPIYIFTPVKL